MSVTSASLLQRPSVIAIEVEQVEVLVAGFLKEQAELYTRRGPFLLVYIVDTPVEKFDFSCCQIVTHCVASGCTLLVLRIQANRRIDDYLVIREAELVTLAYGRANIDVPNGPTVGQNIALPHLRREERWN